MASLIIYRCFQGETMNNEVENEEPKKGCWRKLLEVAESCLAHQDKDKWLEQMRGYLSLMATVIATMTFQMALNPPGGIRSVRDDPQSPGSAKNSYAYPPGRANNGYANSPAPNNVDTEIECGKFGVGTYWDLCPGEAVIGVVYPEDYFLFLVSNTICFVASLSVCLLFVSGIRLKYRLPMWILSFGMCITLTSLAFSYVTALRMTAPGDVFYRASKFLERLVYTWMGLVAIVLLWYVLRLVNWGVKKYRKRSNNKKLMTQKTTNETPVC
jgi:ribose/xylose/arabinose/galactoside ABC-type transport system permease subunit